MHRLNEGPRLNEPKLALAKDLNGALDLARVNNTAMPLTSLCAEVHRMLTAAGLGGEDEAALMEFFKGPDKEKFT